ncbi:MAG: muramoyltetrapeptide carboxypeptidase [Bacteroidota bacterium]
MKIKSGDTVLLIATARSVTQVELQPFLHWAQEHRLLVEFAPNLFEVDNQFAGTDQQRAEDLLWALQHPTATAVFCARGGYGTIRTIKFLENFIQLQGSTIASLMQNQWTRKLFIGFSDVTVLHAWLNNNNWISLHGPVAVQWGKEDFTETQTALENALFTKQISIDTQNLEVLNAAPFTANLVGGNLSLIFSLLSTPYRVKWENAALLIEDLDEYLYHVDRMMQSLESADLFTSAKAILVGGMSEMRDNSVPFGENAVEIIRKIALKYQIPVIFGVPIGHLSTNYSVFLGTSITFDGRFLIQNA